MCFSAGADLTAGVALLPVGVLALREVKHVRELPFASLPLLFALHQLVEALVWAGTTGDVSSGVQGAASCAYVSFALPVLPTLMPLAVLMLEPHGARLRVAPFVGLGLVVSAHLANVVASGPIVVEVHPHSLVYRVGLDNAAIWTFLYVVAVIGPSLLSGYRSIVGFGVLNLVGIVAVVVLYVESFASLWCVYAALSSLLVLVHMRRRRRLPDPHRLDGLPLVTSGSS